MADIRHGTVEIAPWTTERQRILQKISAEREARENETLVSSRERMDAILETIATADQDHAQDAADSLRHESDLQQSELQRIAELPMYAESMEEHEKILGEVTAAREEQQAMVQKLQDMATAGETVRLQMLKERSLVQATWARQDKLIAKIKERRAAKRAKSTAPPAQPAFTARDIEFKLRSLAKRERLAGQLSANAAAVRDKAAWERAQKIIDKLFEEREPLFKALEQIDKSKSDALYEELYMR